MKIFTILIYFSHESQAIKQLKYISFYNKNLEKYLWVKVNFYFDFILRIKHLSQFSIIVYPQDSLIKINFLFIYFDFN